VFEQPVTKATAATARIAQEEERILGINAAYRVAVTKT